MKNYYTFLFFTIVLSVLNSVGMRSSNDVEELVNQVYTITPDKLAALPYERQQQIAILRAAREHIRNGTQSNLGPLDPFIRKALLSVHAREAGLPIYVGTDFVVTNEKPTAEEIGKLELDRYLRIIKKEKLP